MPAEVASQTTQPSSLMESLNKLLQPTNQTPRQEPKQQKPEPPYDRVTVEDTERYVARPGDRLEVKDTHGKTVDIWQVLSTSMGSKEVSVRSTRTGRTLKVPADVFDLKKYRAGGSEKNVREMPKRFFVPHKDGEDNWTVQNVPILRTTSRGKEIYSEEYLDRLVATFWRDLEEVTTDFSADEPQGFYPTVIEGHTYDEPLMKNEQRPARGFVSALWRSGNTVMANFSGISDEYIRRLRAGEFPNRSCEVKVKNQRIVSVALLSEEPYFHLPQMRRFSAEGGDETLFRFSCTPLERNTSMQIDQQAASQAVEGLKTAAAFIQSLSQNTEGDPNAGGNPNPNPNPPGNPSGMGNNQPSNRFAEGSQPSTAGDLDEDGVDKKATPVGSTSPETGVDAKNRPTDSTGNKVEKPGDKPNESEKMSDSEEIDKLKAENRRLQEMIQDMGKKVKFSADHIANLQVEKRKADYKRRLHAAIQRGVAIGTENVDGIIERAAKFSEEDADEYLKTFESMPASVVPRTRVGSGDGSSVGLDEIKERYSGDYQARREEYEQMGVDKDTFAASLALEELMPGELDAE